MTQNHYQVLGVSENATHEQVRKAYKIQAMKFHPDKNKSPEAEAKFKAINEAHEVLTDVDKRAEYDRELRNPQPTHQPQANGNRARRQSAAAQANPFTNPFTSNPTPNYRPWSANYSTPRPRPTYQPKPSQAQSAGQANAAPAAPKKPEENRNVRYMARPQMFFRVYARPQPERVSRSSENEVKLDVATYILLLHVERLLQQQLLLLLLLKEMHRIQQAAKLANHETEKLTSHAPQFSKAPVEESEARREVPCMVRLR